MDGKQAISVLRRLFLSSMFDRMDGSKLLGGMPKIGHTLFVAWMAASPPVEVSPKWWTLLPTAAKNSILSASRLQGYVWFRHPLHSLCLTVWNFQNGESVRVESVNRHRAYFPLVRLFQTLKNAAKV